LRKQDNNTAHLLSLRNGSSSFRWAYMRISLALVFGVKIEKERNRHTHAPLSDFLTQFFSPVSKCTVSQKNLENLTKKTNTLCIEI